MDFQQPNDVIDPIIKQEVVESEEIPVNEDLLVKTEISVGQMRLGVKQTNPETVNSISKDKAESTVTVAGETNTKTVSKMKELLSEFCELNCGVCDELIRKLSQHVNSDHTMGVEKITPDYLDEDENIKIEYAIFPPEPEPDPPILQNEISPESKKKEIMQMQIPPQGLHCTKCPARFFKRENLEQHYRNIHNPTPFNFPCTECRSEFTTYKGLTRHVRLIHLNDSLTRHKRIHSRVKSFCNSCGISLGKISVLKTHESKIRIDAKPHKCKVCGKGFADPSWLKAHMISHNEVCVPKIEPSSSLVDS